MKPSEANTVAACTEAWEIGLNTQGNFDVAGRGAGSLSADAASAACVITLSHVTNTAILRQPAARPFSMRELVAR